MPIRVFLLLVPLTAATANSASPDDPGAKVPAAQYRSVTSGTRSYRPVVPLPWGDINRRVAPKLGGSKEGAMPDTKGAAPNSGSQHKH
jgi:hypothetical protein